jgi:hypothetical protein
MLLGIGIPYTVLLSSGTTVDVRTNFKKKLQIIITDLCVENF